ncbi:hypothetical protein EJB05_15097 [Eragrostis curvula]|uniref:Uncharacterized protein n=1 Tax=Eragrostis curvula TaxID=38414 RepID=A0A5J9W0A6_9POAL|nr:hypothetical protein EJB05_15097 [Eragrostis curvula]
MASARLGGAAAEKKAAAMPVLFRSKPNLADHVFKFCMVKGTLADVGFASTSWSCSQAAAQPQQCLPIRVTV